MNNKQHSTNTTALIFVYGSLKRGQKLHSEIADQQFVGHAVSSPEYRLFDCGSYPAMVKVSDNGVSIQGEVYRVDERCLSRLDDVEAVDDGLYVREIVNLLHSETAISPTTSRVWAWFYLHEIAGLKDCGGEWP